MSALKLFIQGLRSIFEDVDWYDLGREAARFGVAAAAWIVAVAGVSLAASWIIGRAF